MINIPNRSLDPEPRFSSFATKTREAANDIADRVAGAHQVSAEVIGGQHAIGGVVRMIEDKARSIDDAVGLQANTDINSNVPEISQMVAHAARGSDAIRMMAADLAVATARLRARVAAFVGDLSSSD